MKYIDLHTHSTASDGTDSPAALVAKAAGQGLGAIALTDHDTVAGLDEAAEAARDLGIYFVRGCELSTKTEHGEMHILGLWLPQSCETLDNFLRHLRGMRDERNTRMIAKLQACGFNITMAEVLAHATSSVGRPHMAAVLVEKSYVASRAEAFDKYLGHGGLAYVPKIVPRPEQACRLLKDLGATVSLAHPLLRPRPEGWLQNFVTSLIPAGLSALEAWHSSHTDQQAQEIIKLARANGLGLTGGSDYHGEAKAGINLGTGHGNLHIPATVLEDLRNARAKAGLPQ